MLRLIYLLLQNHINTKCSTWIKHCDLYLRQYEQLQDDVVFVTPSVYIRFLPIEWQTIAHDRQTAELNFEIHLVTETAYGDSRDLTDTQFINHIAYETQLFAILHNYRFALSMLPAFAHLKNTPQDSIVLESISRTRTVPHDQLSNLNVSVQSFRTKIYDYAAVPQFQSVLAALNLQVNIVETFNP
jgi:hypothetical protein